jgi:4-amino-4-deoxy-L-arabinose transferase-like glycosyltransferase
MKKNIWHNFIIIFFFLTALAIAGVLHGYNMLHFPYFESDEGTYTSQAWSIVREHKITPYTYWYDHPPLGWSLMALWHNILPEKFFTFGTSLETGRVLMLLIHLLTAGLIYYITYRLTKQVLPSLLAVIIFSISPLGIYFQRRVLLDNIMVMWTLLATAVLYIRYEKLRLTTYVLSGLFFAFAVLTKVTAVMFGPALLYLVWMHRSPIEKHFRSIIWLATGGLVISIYLLVALLRGEFFPGNDHVSFLGALKFQSSRMGGHFWLKNSDFYVAVGDWFQKDAGLLVIIAGTVILAGLVFFFKKNIRFFLVAVLFYILFLIRGGVVINFYILPLIPFVAILAGLSLHYIIQFLMRYNIIYQIAFLALIGGLSFYYYQYAPHDVFWRDETTNQKEALNWIKENIPADSAILIDVFAFSDLHDPNYLNGKAFSNADWYYKVSRDKAIGEKKYNYDWRNFDYIFLTHEMLKQIKDGDDDFIKIAFQNSLPLKRWTDNTHAFIDEQKFLSTNGDWAMLFKINDNTQTELRESWLQYKKNYIHSYGQVIDPASGITTAEAQGLAMLKAVVINDKETFKGLWLWTKDHLQFRVQDKLFSGAWSKDKVLESDNSSVADSDIALALLFAYKEWGDESYLNEAKEIIGEIWRQEVREIDGHYYVLATNELSSHRGLPGDIWFLVNPAHFSPATYRIFAEVDPEHDWRKVADDSYWILERLNEKNIMKTVFPEEFIVSPKTGLIKKDKPTALLKKKSDDLLALEKFEEVQKFNLPWRLSIDREWYPGESSENYFKKINAILDNFSQDNVKITGLLDKKGRLVSEDNSSLLQFAYIMLLLWDEKEQKTHNYYDKYILTQYDYINNIWRGEDEYFNNTWGWFIMAGYNKKFPNIWQSNIL